MSIILKDIYNVSNDCNISLGLLAKSLLYYLDLLHKIFFISVPAVRSRPTSWEGLKQNNKKKSQKTQRKLDEKKNRNWKDVMTEDLRRQIPTLSLWSFTPSTPQLWPLSTWTCLSCLFSSWFGSSSLCHCWLFFWELFLLFTEEKIPICCFKPSPASFFVNKLRLRQHRRIGDVAVQRPHGDVQRPADRFAYRYQQPSLPSRTICSFNSGRRVTTPAIFRCHCRPVDDIFDQQLEPFRLFGHPIPLCPAPRRQRREVSFDFFVYQHASWGASQYLRAACVGSLWHAPVCSYAVYHTVAVVGRRSAVLISPSVRLRSLRLAFSLLSAPSCFLFARSSPFDPLRPDRYLCVVAVPSLSLSLSLYIDID